MCEIVKPAARPYYRSLDPLLIPAALPKPADWPAIFGRTAPLEVEVGFGNGEVLARRSQAEADRDFVGLEIAWASIKRALRRLANPPRSNVRVMNLAAGQALKHFFAPRSISVVWALFPVPWPRDRHEKKRLFQTAFLDLVANRLTDEGRFQLVTDSEVLALWTLEQAKASALTLTMTETPALIDSKYERKWQAGGQERFFHLTGLKTRHPEVSLPEDFAMQAFYIDSFEPAAFKPQGQSGDVTIKFKEFFYDQGQAAGLQRAFVVDEGLVQDFYIRIARTPEGSWKITPAIPGQLIPTRGVALALELVKASAGS